MNFPFAGKIATGLSLIFAKCLERPAKKALTFFVDTSSNFQTLHFPLHLTDNSWNLLLLANTVLKLVFSVGLIYMLGIFYLYSYLKIMNNKQG